MAKKSLSELKAILQAEKSDALASFNASTLSADRSKAMDYYLGDMAKDMPSLPDRSKAVSTDVADTVEGLMPSLMEIFTSADQVVQFEPVGIEDEEAAKQETDYVNHVFMQKNPGFIVLHDFIKDALIQKNGFVKVWWSVEEREERETYRSIGDDVFALFADDDSIEIVEHSSYPDPDAAPPELAPQAGAPAGAEQVPSLTDQPQLHDVTIVKRTEYGCAKVEGVPPEEFGISRRAKSVKDADYCFHETTKSYAELLGLGFDAASLKALPTSEPVDTEEKQSRDTVDETEFGPDATLNDATRSIRVTEHYIRMDYDGSGARLQRITTGGDSHEVLLRDGQPAVDEVPFIPFASMSPIRMPHRFFGRSIADIVSDIQRIKTALLRNILDNLYRINNARTEVPEAAMNANTIDDLLDNRPGGIVRTKQAGLMREVVSVPIADKIFPALEYFDSVREWRTGVTRQGQGIDADALQNQTATAVSKVYSAAQARMRLIARIFAETGIKDLFSLLHATIRMNETKAQTVRLRNQWVEIDPRQFRTRDDMTIDVGIGSGNKEQRFAFLMNLLSIQEKAMLSGTGLASPPKIYATLQKLVELGDLKSAEPYFDDPSKTPPQPPKPDPEMAKVQAQAEAKKAELEQSGQIKQAQMQQEAQLEMQKMRAEFALSQQQMQAEMALEMQKMQAEMRLEMIRIRQDGAIQADRNVRQAASADRKANLSAVRQGGKVG